MFLNIPQQVAYRNTQALNLINSEIPSEPPRPGIKVVLSCLNGAVLALFSDGLDSMWGSGVKEFYSARITAW